MMPPLFPVTFALYAVACALYVAYLWSGGEASPLSGPAARDRGTLVRAAGLTLGAACLSHAIDIGWLCVQGQHPMVNAREALSFAAWLMCGAYLAASLRLRVPVVGALVVPVTMVLDLLARVSPSHEGARAASWLGAVHITLATAGVALFAVAAGGAVVYLVSERNLKARKAGRLFRRGPALETLDRLNRRCIVVGFPVFTVAIITGSVWQLRLAHELLTPQYALAVAGWVMYAVLLVARVTAGWRGRRAAIMTLGGFATSLAVLLIYFVRSLGGTQG